jgi:hypothetical protein
MSYDYYEQEYHLTPTGWKSGASHSYGRDDQEVKPPLDRVLTVVKEVKQSSGWSPEDISWHESWRSCIADRGVVEKLIKQFGSRPSEPDKSKRSESLNSFFSKQ